MFGAAPGSQVQELTRKMALMQKRLEEMPGMRERTRELEEQVTGGVE